MRIGLITTLDTNIGDDFIREGICLVLRQVFEGRPLEFRAVNKHDPLSVYPDWHPIQRIQSLVRRLPRGRARLLRYAAKLFSRVGFSRFDDCDLVIQCGTPVAWPDCSRCEWAEPLWDQVVGRLSLRGTPVLNLGAGACYPWERQPARVVPETDAVYLRRILQYCRVTTVRDRLAQRLFESLGHSCRLIPCPALLAGRPFRNAGIQGDHLVINYMEGAGHYEWGQGIPPAAWRDLVRMLLTRLRAYHPIVFLCHNQREYELAETLDATTPRFLPRNSQEYFALASRAKLALCNRLHASIALAGLGVPSMSVGTDTRVLMVDAAGLPYFYVKDVTVEGLEEAIQHLLRNYERERDRLLGLHESTWHQYREVIEKALEVGHRRE